MAPVLCNSSVKDVDTLVSKLVSDLGPLGHVVASALATSDLDAEGVEAGDVAGSRRLQALLNALSRDPPPLKLLLVRTGTVDTAVAEVGSKPFRQCVIDHVGGPNMAVIDIVGEGSPSEPRWDQVHAVQARVLSTEINPNWCDMPKTKNFIERRGQCLLKPAPGKPSPKSESPLSGHLHHKAVAWKEEASSDDRFEEDAFAVLKAILTFIEDNLSKCDKTLEVATPEVLSPTAPGNVESSPKDTPATEVGAKRGRESVDGDGVGDKRGKGSTSSSVFINDKSGPRDVPGGGLSTNQRGLLGQPSHGSPSLVAMTGVPGIAGVSAQIGSGGVSMMPMMGGNVGGGLMMSGHMLQQQQHGQPMHHGHGHGHGHISPQVMVTPLLSHTPTHLTMPMAQQTLAHDQRSLQHAHATQVHGVAGPSGGGMGTSVMSAGIDASNFMPPPKQSILLQQQQQREERLRQQALHDEAVKRGWALTYDGHQPSPLDNARNRAYSNWLSKPSDGPPPRWHV